MAKGWIAHEVSGLARVSPSDATVRFNIAGGLDTDGAIASDGKRHDQQFIHAGALREGRCPHCLKGRLFLLEAGLADRVTSREFTPGDDREAAIRDELGGKLDKVTFPASQVAPDQYIADSNGIIASYSEMFSVDPGGLPVFQTYVEQVLPNYMAARKEVSELKRQLA